MQGMMRRGAQPAVAATQSRPAVALHTATASSQPRAGHQRHSAAATPLSRGAAVVPRAASLETLVSATDAAYVGLGLAGASFVGTFFVAPQFKDAFKEELDWKAIYTALQQAGGVQQLDAGDAAAQSGRGAAVLVDVRLASKYEAGHADASLSCPLYQPIQKWDLASNIRRAAHAFFGLMGTELNPRFVAEVEEKVPKGKQIILLCESGGSLQNKSGTKFGFQSRSLKAAFFLKQAGYKVATVEGGLPCWVRVGLPMAEGQEDLDAVPALNMPDAADEAGVARPGSPLGGLRDLLGGLTQRLPQLVPARR